jgi:hypothetical protein
MQVEPGDDAGLSDLVGAYFCSSRHIRRVLAIYSNP